EMLLAIYANEDKGRLYEQPFVSHTLLTQNAYQRLSPRYNWGVLEFLVMQFPEFFGKVASLMEVKAIMPHLLNELDKAYFLHFAGCPGVFQNYAAIAASTPEVTRDGLRYAS